MNAPEQARSQKEHRDLEIRILALLEAILRGDENPMQAALRREAELASARLHGLPERIRFLVGRLGFKDVDSRRLTAAWTERLAAGNAPTRSELLDIARKLSRAVENDEGPLGHWKRALLSRLESTTAREAFEAQRSAGLRMEALLTDWPRRLLEHPAWAYAESPLPDMQPLPLDDVWVELQLVDSENNDPIREGASLQEILDQRYEERYWRARPLEFTIERFEGSAALVGPPGSGKTTLLKWIARWIIRRPEGRFVLPFLVPLRSYGLWRNEHPGRDLLDFALFSAGVREPAQWDLWSNVLSYLSGPNRDHVLLLLDGWDEVRPEDRELVYQDIENQIHGFAVIITSRPSGPPRKLPIYDLFEIAELSPESTDQLIRRWFARADASESATEFKAQIDRNVDLRRMARNPFLLSLLCGLGLRSGERRLRKLPDSRSALYKSAISLILSHHDERYAERRFGTLEQRQAERLALWLLDESPEAPQFVFGRDEVTACCGRPELLDDYLKPSRLLAQLGLSDSAHHFLHTTFQEYLAAQALIRQSPETVVETIRRRACDASWLEVLRFLSGSAGFAEVFFWQEMTRLAQEPDRYGHIFLRLARFAAETRPAQGGLQKLGVDLRDELWNGITNSTFSGRFVEAFAALDGSDLVRRFQEVLEGDDQGIQERVLRNLGRVPESEASYLLVEQLQNPIWFEEALEQLRRYRRMHPRGLAEIRRIAFAPDTNARMRGDMMSALGELHDTESIPKMKEAARRYPEQAKEVLSILGWMGGEQATEAVYEMTNWRSDSEWQSYIVAMLGTAATPRARDLLLERLALLDLEDPLTPNVLNALHGIPISDGAELILAVLQADLPPSTRAAAAHALQEAAMPGIVDALAQAAGGDPDESVRCAALQSLDGRGRPNEIGWLKSRVGDATRTEEERALALKVLLTTSQRFAYSADGDWLLARAAAAVLHLLERLDSEDLAQAAAELAYLAGEATAPRLLEIASDPSAPWRIRCGACFSLGRLRVDSATDGLAELVRRGAHASPRDRRTGALGPWAEGPRLRWEVEGDRAFLPPQTVEVTMPEHRVGMAAADALARIDPSVLLGISGVTADNALAAWALETGALVFEDHILGADGKVFARRPKSPLGEFPPAFRSIPTPDLKLFIRSQTIGNRHELRFELSLRDPSFGMLRDEFGPSVLGRDPREYRRDLIQDIERLPFDESPEVIGERLRAKGKTLFSLLPLGAQMWLWTLRERIKTVQIFSDELYLPWEMLQLSRQAGQSDPGSSLAEAFALTRWRDGVPEQFTFSLTRMAVVASGTSRSSEVRKELNEMVELFGDERITVIAPRYETVLDALKSGQFDGWHFIGHANAHADDADRWEIFLEDGRTLRPEDLRGLQGFGRRRPWVFLNGCKTGLAGEGLDGPGGWALRSLEGGAGAFLGTHWAIPGSEARRFALEVYKKFLAGTPLGETVAQARRQIKIDDPGSPTWLAYTVYGHPLATWVK